MIISERLRAHLRIICRCAFLNTEKTGKMMMKTRSDELIKIEAESKDIVKEMLEQLKQKNHEIEIGFKK